MLYCQLLYLKCREYAKSSKKTKKTGPFAVCKHTAKDFWSLCRVHTHGKGATWRQPVDLGAPGGVPVGDFAVRGRARPHGKGEHGNEWWRTAMSGARQRMVAHGKVLAHGSLPAARQRSGARQRWQRTAEMATHGKGLCRAVLACARQRWLCRRRRCRAVFAVSSRTAKPLPCV